MARFCTSCRFPLGANGTFCPQCGSRQDLAATPAPAPQPAPGPALSPASGGSGLKILMVVMVCLGVAGLAVIGGVYYAYHRVKEAVVEKAKENGVDLNTIVPPKTSTVTRHKTHKACDLLSKEEAAQLLGEPVDRAVYQDKACMFMGPEGLSAKLAETQAHNTFQSAQAPNAKPNVTDITNAVDQLGSSIAASSGMQGVGVNGEMPLLMLSVDDDGKGAMAGLNATSALFSGIYHAAAPDQKDARFGSQIKGLGDQAVRLPKLGLNVLQGNTVIGLIPGPIPDPDTKTVAIARLILGRL